MTDPSDRPRERDDVERLRRELQKLGFYSGIWSDGRFLVTLTDDKSSKFSDAIAKVNEAPPDFPQIILETDSPKWNAERVRALRRQPLVGGFIFRRVTLDAEMAAALVELPALESLELDHVKIGADAAQTLAQLPALTALQVARVDGGQLVLQSMQSVDTLRRLEVRWSLPGEPVLEPIAGISQLTELTLWEMAEQAGDPRRLAALENLESLAVHESSWTTDEFSFLASLKNLAHLVIRSNVALGDGLLSGFKDHRRLNSVTVWNTQITNQGLGILSTCTGLEELYLRHSQIDDRGLGNLASLSNLKRLWLEYSRVSGAGLAAAELPAGLQTISIGPAFFRTQDLKRFPKSVQKILRASLMDDGNGGLQIWDVSNGTLEMMGAAAYEPLAAVSNGTRLAATYKNDVALFNLKTGQFVRRFDLRPFNVAPWQVAITADGRTVAVAQDDSVLVMDFDTRETIATLPWEHAPVSVIRFSPNGRFLAAATERKTVLWNLPDGQVVQELTGTRPAFSTRSTFFAAFQFRAPVSRSFSVYRLGQDEPVYAPAAGGFSASFLDDEIFVVGGSGTTTQAPWVLERHSVAQRKRLDEIDMPSGRLGNRWAVSTDGKRVAIAEGLMIQPTGPNVTVVDLATGNRLAAINAGADVTPPVLVDSPLFVDPIRVAVTVRHAILRD